MYHFDNEYVFMVFFLLLFKMEGILSSIGLSSIFPKFADEKVSLSHRVAKQIFFSSSLSVSGETLVMECNSNLD